MHIFSFKVINKIIQIINWIKLDLYIIFAFLLFNLLDIIIENIPSNNIPTKLYLSTIPTSLTIFNTYILKNNVKNTEINFLRNTIIDTIFLL